MTNTASNLTSRPLDNWVVGISISESENLADWGCSTADVNRATVRLSEALLAAGARLVFGHDWRPDGVMDAICRFAVKFQTPTPRGTSEPLIRNLLAWPNQPAMTIELRRDLEQRGVLRVETLGVPNSPWQTPTDPIAKAIALTHLRRELAKCTDARICLGGREGLAKDAQPLVGFYAGVIEEAFFSAAQSKPVYVAGFLGGAAAKLTLFLRHPSQRSALKHAFAVLPAKVKIHESVAAQPGPSLDEPLVPPRDLSKGFDPVRFQSCSGLHQDEWHGLLNTSDIESFTTLVIRGLRQRATRHNPRTVDDRDVTANNPSTAKPKRGSRQRGDS